MSPEERVPFARGRRHAPHRPGAALSLPLAARRRKAEPPAPRAPEPQSPSQPASRFCITSFVFIWRLSVLLFRVNKLYIKKRKRIKCYSQKKRQNGQ